MTYYNKYAKGMHIFISYKEIKIDFILFSFLIIYSFIYFFIHGIMYFLINLKGLFINSK